MSEMDWDARLKSQKALSVIFIILIVLSNMNLLRLLAASGKLLLQSPRRIILISMALGDIFFALFALVVFARSVYEENFQPSCNTSQSAWVYLYFYFPFVYGLSLLVLTMELIKRKMISSSHNNPTLASLCLNSVSWMCGLVIILPLVWAHFDWDKCKWDDSGDDIAIRFRAAQAVAIIVPSILALACVVFLTNGRWEAMPDVYVSNQQGVAYGVSGTVLVAPPTGPIAFEAPFASASPPPYEMATDNMEGVYDTSQGFSNPGFFGPHLSQQSQFPTQEQFPQQSQFPTEEQFPQQSQFPTHGQFPQQSQFPTQGQSPQGQHPVHPEQGYPAPQATPQPPYFGQSMAATTLPPVTTVENLKEKSALTKACIGYITLMLPFAIVNMVFRFNADPPNWSEAATAAITDGVFWLSLFRAVVLPAFWINTLGN